MAHLTPDADGENPTCVRRTRHNGSSEIAPYRRSLPIFLDSPRPDGYAESIARVRETAA